LDFLVCPGKSLAAEVSEDTLKIPVDTKWICRNGHHGGKKEEQ
jgi:hypothetical protein